MVWCRSDPHHEFQGLNCLRQAQTLKQTAKQARLSEEEARQVLASCREKLHQRRVQRPRPHLDDKVSLVCVELRGQSAALEVTSHIVTVVQPS